MQRVRSELKAALARAAELDSQQQNIIIKHESSTLNEQKLSEQVSMAASDLICVKGMLMFFLCWCLHVYNRPRSRYCS